MAEIPGCGVVTVTTTLRTMVAAAKPPPALAEAVTLIVAVPAVDAVIRPEPLTDATPGALDA